MERLEKDRPDVEVPSKEVARASAETRDYNYHNPQRLRFRRRLVLDGRLHCAGNRRGVMWCRRVTWGSQVTLRGGRTDCGADGGRWDAFVTPAPRFRPSPPSLP